MAQRIFQSFRRLPGHLASINRKPDINEAQGSSYKAKVCSDYGFPAKPVSVAYDPVLDLLSLLTRDGKIAVYGKPGVVFTATHGDTAEFIQVLFLNGTRKLITLTESDDVYLWELSLTPNSSVRFVQISCLKNVTQKLRSNFVNGITDVENSEQIEGTNHVTAICAMTDGAGLLVGTENGWVASIRTNTPSKLTPKNFEYLTLPTAEEAITPSRILNGLTQTRQHRLRLDAVVVLSERPGFPGQLLIGYSSGLSLIYDIRADRVVALLPWKHGLEAATWCGGNGLPHRSSTTVSPTHLGTRLLTAHSDGSLGVWNLRDVRLVGVTSSPVTDPPTLNMEEPPTRPYGPFPCKLISKVFWLSSPLGGITAFVGGMPRATYGERHTVSLLRGSNLDRAAAANVVAARIAAATQAEDDDDDDDDDLMLGAGRVPNTPMHVFDPDAPEHVCFDLTSRLVDLLPVGPVGGPAQMLLLLCEEELVAVDLMSPGWPFIRPPYLACLHTAAITTYSLVTQVNPSLLANLEAAGAYYGPEGRFGRGSAIVNNQNAAGWSSRPWPIRGGVALVNGARLTTSLLDENSLFTDDLLLTGHEDGSVAFWRLSACGCLRRIYTLHTAILFEGDFGLPGHGTEAEDEVDAWPPFRQAGVFDPFMDDSRAAVQVIRLVDHTLIVGGAAGQVTVWQFLNYVPVVQPVTAAIKTDIPGFQWKGYAPLRIRPSVDQSVSAPAQTEHMHTASLHSTSNRTPPGQLQATGIILVQPPARITALGLVEIPESGSSPEKCIARGLLVALGTPHGYSAIHLPPVNPPSVKAGRNAPHTLWVESTLPDNLDALQEAAAGEGWARRRTRELKKSLRDSFRRLKRMRSTKLSANPNSTGEPPVPVSAINRTGVRRTVTQTNRVVGRQIHSGPLEEAERRARGDSDQLGTGSAGLPPVSIEREICDRPVDSASVAIVTCFTFGPSLFRFSSHHTSSPSGPATNHAIGSLFVGTKAGIVKAYALFADRDLTSSNGWPSTYRLQLAKQLLLQHRAPILTVRLVDSKSFQPLPSMGLDPSSTVNPRSSNMPYLLVVSEEQVRLFSLPGLRLKHKARITAKDGYRIKAGALIAFRSSAKANVVTEKIGDADSACVDLDRSNTSALSTPLHSASGDSQSEYSFVFTNVGGQAIVLNMPVLTRRDTLSLLDSADVVAVNSVTFAEPGCSIPSNATSVTAPALGLYQLAPGQLTMFDVVKMGQHSSVLGASYRPIHRIPDPSTAPNSAKSASGSRTGLSNGSTADTSGISSRGTMPPPSLASANAVTHRSNMAMYHNTTTTTGSISYGSSQLNSSVLSNTLSDSVRDCFTPPSGSSFASTQLGTHR